MPLYVAFVGGHFLDRNASEDMGENSETMKWKQSDKESWRHWFMRKIKKVQEIYS